MELSKDLQALFPTLHEKLSAYWQEGDTINKVNMAQIKSRLPRKFCIMRTETNVGKHELWLCMSEPKRRRIEAMAVMHEYSEKREDGFRSFGSEMLYFEAGVTLSTLKELRNGLTGIIGDENELLEKAKKSVREEIRAEIRSEEALRKKNLIDKPSFYGSIKEPPSKVQAASTNTKFDTGIFNKKLSYDIYLQINNSEQRVIADKIRAHDVHAALVSLTKYAPLGQKDFSNDMRTAYLVYETGSRQLVKTVRSDRDL